MFSSTEVRWFFEEGLPHNISEWFELFDPEYQDPRTDYYLNFTEKAQLGIKLRENNIQIKPKKEDLGIISFLEKVEGHVWHYEKWSFPVVTNEEWTELVARPDVWVPVKKIRKIMRYTLEGGFPDRIAMDEQTNEGCEVELSEVEVMDREFWSLAFEAFGTTAEANLQKAVREIFERHSCPVSFPKEKSLGYARLIHDIQV